MNIFKYLNMLAAALALSAGIAYAQEDCGCDSVCEEVLKPKYVALSFDDGPSLRCTLDTVRVLLDVLEENGVKASFFLIGQNITEETAPIIRRMVQMGCDVENHTYSHPNLTQIPDSLILAEVAKTDSLIEAYAGAKPVYLRPPFTAHNAHVAGLVDGKIFVSGLSCQDWRADMPVEDRVTKTLERAHRRGDEDPDPRPQDPWLRDRHHPRTLPPLRPHPRLQLPEDVRPGVLEISGG